MDIFKRKMVAGHFPWAAQCAFINDSLQNLLAWRKEFKPEGITEEDVAPLIDRGTMDIRGTDQDGRPIIIVNCRNFRQTPEDRQDILRCLSYMLERTTEQSSAVSDGYVNVIVDMKGTYTRLKSLGFVSLIRNVRNLRYSVCVSTLAP